MKTQILPNWCKKLGLFLFTIASFINGSFNFLNTSINKSRTQGISASDIEVQASEYNGLIGIINMFTGGGLIYSIDFIAIIGMLIYMTSKEKIEDDYITKLRLESFQLTTIIGLMIAIILFFIAKDQKFTLDYFIFPFLWSYLIIFFIKRRMYL